MVNQVKMAEDAVEEAPMEKKLPSLSTTTSQSNLRRKRGPNEGLK
jgi:hypothetical protein